MNTQYLSYVLEVERVGSISQAAQNLYIAQPNLSKSIKDLEKELGFTLFKRTSSGVQVTEAGSEFLYHARQITITVPFLHSDSSTTKARIIGNEYLSTTPKTCHLTITFVVTSPIFTR